MTYICKIGITPTGTPTDITRYVKELKPFGGNPKISSASFPGNNRFALYHEGSNARGWELGLHGNLEETSLDAVIALFNKAIEESKFYPFSANRFVRIAKAGAWEDQAKNLAPEAWKAAAIIYATIQDLFDNTATIWTPQTDEEYSITALGSIPAPLDEVKIVGSYVENEHCENPTIELWNAAGTTLEDSLVITNMLLTDEELTLDYRGKITQVYSDTFATSAKFVQDAENEGCTIENEGLVIPKGCSATYLLSGPWPLTNNIVITATQVIGSGNVYLQYSFDNAAWRDAISNTDMLASTTWTIPNTAGHGDVYIRFATYSDEVEDTERTNALILADITSAVRNRDDYVKGVWGKNYNAGDWMLLIKLGTDIYAYQMFVPTYPSGSIWYVGSAYEASVAFFALSVAVAVTDRTDAQILADITTPTPAQNRDNYVKGVWGRVLEAGSYMLLIKLDGGKYAYQLLTQTVQGSWTIGTDTEATDALYAASTVSGDRSDATMLAEITTPTPARNRDTYVKGVWGRVYGTGNYMRLVKLAADKYAYQPFVEANGSNAWGIGTAAEAASIFYSYCAIPTQRTSAQILTEVNGTTRNRDNYVIGVWGRTLNANDYMLLIKLASDTYAYQVHTQSGVSSWYVGTKAQAASAMYNASASGPRSSSDILADITNSTFQDPALGTIHYHAYGTTANINPTATIIQVQNSGPKTLAYKITTDSGDSSWAIDALGGTKIRDALVAASTTVVLRTQQNILDDINGAGFVEPSTYSYTVEGPFTGVKPSALIIQVENSPQVLAYQIANRDGTYDEWVIDSNAGMETRESLNLATPSPRTAADILADVRALTWVEASTYQYQVYGYVDGARPIATVVQLQNSPQILCYKIAQTTGVDTAWLIEANAGADCRTALTTGYSGLSSRTQADIQADITNSVFVAPTAIDWQVYGLNAGEKPYANVILVQNTPRVYAYQVDYMGTNLSTWAIDDALGVEIADELEDSSPDQEEADGSLKLGSISILQYRRIPWQELPVIPIDGLAHIVKFKNVPVMSSAYLKATSATLGDDETFTATAAPTTGKIYLQANTGKYLSSTWGEDYVPANATVAGPAGEFELVVLETLGSNQIGAIRCASGQYLSASNAGAGFVLATSITIGPAELFEFVPVGSGTWAFKVVTPYDGASSEVMKLDEGILDVDRLDHVSEDPLTYAGKYLVAVSGTLTAVNPVTATYRDRYYI